MTASRLKRLYDSLFDRFGPQHWWPGETPLEIMIGAVLTQNTNWGNVERAIANLRAADALDLERIDRMAPADLAALIRPSGYYNVKAARLKSLVRRIRGRHNDLETFFSLDTAALRDELLACKGIGPETCDSILLYAAERPVFVVDAYTHRILTRHDLIWEEDGYYEMQELFESNLEADVQLFNEYHALIVRCGKEFCRKKRPRCRECPLKEDLGDG